MSTVNKQTASYFWVTATLIAASLEPIIAKMGYLANCTPFQLLCLKSTVGAAMILPLTKQTVWLGFAGIRQILPAAILLLCTSTLMLFSLLYIKASLLITIVTVTPAAVALVNQALGRDVLGYKFWCGFCMCALGLGLTAGTEFGQIHPFGLMLAFTAVFTSTAYRVLLEKLTTTYKPAIVSTYIFLINGLFLIPFFPTMIATLPLQIIASGFWLGIAAAIANVSFLYAISLLGSTRVSIIAMLERPIIIALAAIILHETLSVLQIIGIVLVIVGVQVAKVKRHRLVEGDLATAGK